ncbi:hypothetical protein DERF_011114 [Dermatophagoides farinae]|uniref:Uncharacterized protein n=1 Tax=Dermatophagoides farinae TaxID=6954 RepID=A0A922HRL2_DERFA|nr:hypothetical protein DERF_011114 [Dermatophagoides farinae]
MQAISEYWIGHEQEILIFLFSSSNITQCISIGWLYVNQSELKRKINQQKNSLFIIISHLGDN